MPRKQVSGEKRSLHAVLDNPALPVLIRSLPAQELAQLCGRLGVGDAMEVMTLAPAERLVEALEASVWKTPRPGVSEILDARELTEWLWVWLEIGETFTAERLAVIPDEKLTLYLSHIATVRTTGMWGFERSTEIEDLDRIYAPSYDEKAYGQYIVSARRQEDWEILRGALDAMWLEAPERVLELCALLSGDESMLAPQRNRESSNDDVASVREGARECRGYVTASGARAFLALTRRPVQELAAMSEYDLETRRHLGGLEADMRGANDKATSQEGGHAAVGWGAVDTGSMSGSECREKPATLGTNVAGLAQLKVALEEAGILEPPPERLLLTHERTSKSLLIVTLLRRLSEKDAAEFDARGRELAYLASVLIAGIAVGGETLSPVEARSAALATCNLGVETLRSRGEQVRIDVEPGLVRLFLVGASVLRTLPGRVMDSFAHRLERLKRAHTEPLHEWLVQQAEGFVADLREAARKGDFAEAREAAMALGFVFEPTVCRAVVPLLDELPRLDPGNGGAATWIDSVEAVESAVALLRRIAVKRRLKS